MGAGVRTAGERPSSGNSSRCDTGSSRTSGPPRMPVYPPVGEWIDCWTGRRYAGPVTVNAVARLDVMPLFVRAGAIIPMTKKARRRAGQITSS